MRIEILAIGDELLDGRVTDTNTVRLAQALSLVGMHLKQRTSVTDDLPDIIREVKAIASRGTQLCVVSGGLGPTADDLTAEAFAKLLDVPLVRDAQQEQQIRQRLQERNRQVTPNQLKQADRPQGAEVLNNPVGSAPGFAVHFNGCRFVSVPGVPNEFDCLVEAAVVAPLRQKAAHAVARRGLYCFAIVEGEADKRLAQLTTRWPEVRLQYRVKFPEVHVTMHAPPEAQASLDAAHAFARTELGVHVFSEVEEPFAAAVLRLLIERGATLAVAESCTGGLVTDLLTDVAGSSQVLHLGLVVYSNAAKSRVLDVPDELLAAHGAVSEQVVAHMAHSVRLKAGTTHGMALSGVAGPGGGTAEKPVGTVWLAVDCAKQARTHRLQLPFDRRNNKIVSSYSALDLLRRMLLGTA